MKNHILILILFAFFSVKAFSQVSFSHSIGSSIYSNSEVGGGGLLYSPRLNVVNFDDKASVSIGTHLGIGIGESANSETGALGAFTLDVPLMIEFNAGFTSSPAADDQSAGFFAGVGFGYNSMGGKSELRGYSGSSAGPVLNAGIVAFLFEKPLGFRISYLINVKDKGVSTLGLGLFCEFGNF